MSRLKEGIDYYTNDKGFVVFTEKYLLERGYCCKNGCKHCPYGFAGKTEEEERMAMLKKRRKMRN